MDIEVKSSAILLIMRFHFLVNNDRNATFPRSFLLFLLLLTEQYLSHKVIIVES